MTQASGITPNRTTNKRAALLAIKHLDLGLPVTIGGTEFILLDNLYAKGPSFSGTRPTGYRLLGYEMPLMQFMCTVNEQMTTEEIHNLITREVISEQAIQRRHSTSSMVSDARKIAEKIRGVELQMNGASGIYTESDQLVRIPCVVCATGAMQYQPMSDLNKPGASVESFEVFQECHYRISGQDMQSGRISLGIAYRNAGFHPSPQVLKALDHYLEQGPVRQYTQPPFQNGPSL